MGLLRDVCEQYESIDLVSTHVQDVRCVVAEFFQVSFHVLDLVKVFDCDYVYLSCCVVEDGYLIVSKLNFHCV